MVLYLVTPANVVKVIACPHCRRSVRMPVTFWRDWCDWCGVRVEVPRGAPTAPS